MKKKEIKEDFTKIKLKTVLQLLHQDNVERVCFALARAGYFVRIRKNDFFEVEIYGYANQK